MAPLSQWSNDELRAELEQRGEKLNNIVIRFERVKDGKPYDCPCCTAERNEEQRLAQNREVIWDTLIRLHTSAKRHPSPLAAFLYIND